MPAIPSVPHQLSELLTKDAAQQRSFAWRPPAWKSLMSDVADIEGLDRLPERIDREQVRTFVKVELAADRVLTAFIAAMAWGYGPAGYGPTRVRWVLTGVQAGAANAPIRSQVTSSLRRAAEIVVSDGAVAGFRFLNNEGGIKYLGPAFFTKWLYFASAREDADAPDAAPILDMQVREWLRTHTDVALDIRRTIDYERYFDLLTVWGAAYGRTPVQVEKEIFRLATGR